MVLRHLSTYPRPTVFVSHSTADDGFVWELDRALENLQQPVWIDSREVRGGDLLWPEVQAAIGEAGALAVGHAAEL
jgi:hypothetical protein